MGEGVQVLDVALFEGVVHIAQLAVSGLEGPLLVGVEIAQSDVVDDDVFDEGVAGWGERYRSMQICMLISWPYRPACSSAFSSGMKYFLMRSRQ